MKELDFQAKLVEGAKELGGYGMKLSHKERVGVPDLLLAVKPRLAIIECKREEPVNFRLGETYKYSGPTEKQKIDLMRWRNGGVKTGVAVLFEPKGETVQWILVTPDLEQTSVTVSHTIFIRRRRGDSWTLVVDQLLRKITELAP